MKKQNSLFPISNDNDKISLGNNIFIEIKSNYPRRAYLYRQDILIKQVVLSDKIAKRIFIVEAIELGAMKSRLASVLEISRQTIENLLGIKKHFGLEGLTQAYSPSTSKSRRKQREIHASKNKGIPGNILEMAHKDKIVLIVSEEIITETVRILEEKFKWPKHNIDKFKRSL